MRRTVLLLASMTLAVLLASGVALLALSSRPAAAAATFSVNRTGDAKDRNITDTVCDSSRKRGKQCTLRAAIQEANDTAGADTISFNIGGTTSVKTINVGSTGLGALPTITEAVTIDGYTQPGAMANTLAEGNDAVLKIQLSGTNAGQRANGLQISAADTTIKGLVIGGFSRNGIRVAGTGATGNSIEGNFIGTDASGTARRGNNDGVRIAGGASANTVGGTEPEARNLISGNGDCPDTGFGVRISLASGNFIQGNYIGTDKSGASALEDCHGPFFDSGGVVIEGFDGPAANNTVGGTASGAGNVISGNSLGVTIQGVHATANEVKGNFIGADASGTTNVGNGQPGVLIGFGADNNIIGGTVSGAGNVISGNDFEGVDIGAGSNGNEVEGNTIRNNGGNGVTVVGDDNILGGMTPAAGNQIFDNGGDGVQVTGGTGNRILSNEIYANAKLGIDLGGPLFNDGVTANDEDDLDTGDNNLQNYPVITSATRSSTTGTTTITATLNSNPNQDFIIQCFGTEEGGDPSGHGEGKTFLAKTTTATDANGDSPTFTCSSDVPVVGDRVSATATNKATGDTSEFSGNVQVTSST